MTTPSTPEATEPEPTPAPAAETAPATSAAAPDRKFGLAAATALVMGNIIGGGIFTLPAAVAPYGTVSLLAFVILSVAAVLLALLFGRLAKRSPVTGGLYVYPRDAFGPFAGFLSAWSYWTMCWVSIAALAVGVVGYVDVLIPLGDSKVVLALVALAALWLPAAANFAGTRYVGAVQMVSTVLKFVPLLLVATIGLFFIDIDNYGPFNASGESTPARSPPLPRSSSTASWASSPPPSAPARSRIRSAPWAGPASSARSPPRWSTSSARSPSSAWSRTRNWSSPGRRSPTRSTRWPGAAGAAR